MRPDPIELLERQDETRVPELVPIRYGRMLVSPFTFYRGAARSWPTTWRATPRSGLTAQCCGDAHLSNFGVFASPERRLVFDLNDFDETLPGPWEWDVKRLATSVLIAARHSGFSGKDQDAGRARHGSGPTARRCASSPAMNSLDVWYSHLDIQDELKQYANQFKSKIVERAEKRSPRRARRTACRRSPSSLTSSTAR